MPEPVNISLPGDVEALRALPVGTAVSLSGTVFTARDATHARLVADLERAGALPYGLSGQVLFYAGPTPPAAGRPAGSVGPTTARRMDAATPALLRAGVVAAMPAASRGGVHGSIRFAVVGPTAPAALPAAGGVGPA